ncbi:MAG TPA: phosphoribosyl-dephospho-CoA transferase MdcG domain-containing protein, partial [Reyranella sp.]|nr:phosphoribosyl-dephospho-CoA transferase MdcG domain-containing protein [Reyranella sp.]
AGDVTRLTGELAALEIAAPMRLDGELVRSDGAAVNWRELHDGSQEVLVKTIRDAALASARQFLGAEASS